MPIPLRAEKWALLVGINNYLNDISSLKYCVADVVAFRDALVNVAGFKQERIFLMTDEMEGQMEPTNINVIMRLDILASQIKADDTFVFYFSGHGIAREDQSFLLAANSVTTTANTLEQSAIPLNMVNKILSSVKAQQLLTVIDACRNNPETGRSDENNVLTDDFSKGFKIRRRSGNNGQPSVSATLYACNVGERAYEWAEKGHGVFSYYLLQGLNGRAANSQGQVTVSGLAEYTQGKVVEWAQTYRSKKQTPWLEKSGAVRLVLAENVVTESIQADQLAEAVKFETIETKATLFVSSVPQGATVYINQQKMVDKTPVVVRIDTGVSRQKEVEVGLALDGYETLVMKAKLVGGGLMELKNVNLVKVELPQQRNLRVSSHPLKANVYLDDVLVGKTPFQTQIDLMDYQLKLSLAGYKDWSRQIPTVSDEAFGSHPRTHSIGYDARLAKIPDKPKTGNIIVSSNPSGAKILFQSNSVQNLDGIDESRRTPTTLRGLNVGLYRIILQLDGYKSFARTVSVEGDQTAELRAKLVPSSRQGNIIVSSNPSGAKILFQSNSVQNLDSIDEPRRTPTNLRGLNVGLYTITLQLDDYESFTRAVRVKGGQTVQVKAELVPLSRKGNIIVRSNPSGVRIYLEGIDQLRWTPTTLRGLDVGLHTITLKQSGYKNFTEIVRVEREQTSLIEAELLPPLRTAQAKKVATSLSWSSMTVLTQQRLIGSALLIGTAALILWQADLLPVDTLLEIWKTF
jgi:uncharacterized caspase-like protein